MCKKISVLLILILSGLMLSSPVNANCGGKELMGQSYWSEKFNLKVYETQSTSKQGGYMSREVNNMTFNKNDKKQIATLNGPKKGGSFRIHVEVRDYYDDKNVLCTYSGTVENNWLLNICEFVNETYNNNKCRIQIDPHIGFSAAYISVLKN